MFLSLLSIWLLSPLAPARTLKSGSWPIAKERWVPYMEWLHKLEREECGVGAVALSMIVPFAEAEVGWRPVTMQTVESKGAAFLFSSGWGPEMKLREAGEGLHPASGHQRVCAMHHVMLFAFEKQVEAIWDTTS